jgi:hypothetical protein
MAGERSVANPQGTYNVRALREMVLNARKQGAQDEELVAELESHPVLGPKLEKMRVAGVSPKQAIDNIAVIQKEEKYDPTEGMSGMEKFMAGAGMSVDKMGRGIKQVVGGMLPNAVVSREQKEQWAKENAEADKLNAPLRSTGAGMAGEAVGDITTAMIPGAGATGTALRLIPKVKQAAGLANVLARGGRAVAGAAAGGIGTQAITPESEVLDSAADYGAKALRGAGEGVAGDVIGRGMGRVIKPLRFDIDPAHRERLARLLSKGIGKNTPANSNYGAFDLSQLTDDSTAVALKSSLAKLPFMASSVQKRTNAQFGDVTAAATARTGTTRRTVSPEALDDIAEAIAARKDIVKGSGPVQLDPEYAAEVNAALGSLGRPLSGAPASSLEPLRAAKAVARGNRRTIPMEEALESRSRLSSQAHTAFQSDPIKGRSYQAAQEALDNAIRRSLEKNSPGKADAWDLLRRNEGASLDIAKAAASPGGRLPGDMLNPRSLATQVRGSEGKLNFSRGKSATDLAQLADDATRVITDQTANSGTTPRALYSMLLLGGLGGVGGALSADNTTAGGALGSAAMLLGGPLAAKHAMFGRGPFGAKHLAHGAFGEKMSKKALEQLAEKSPALFAQFMETMRQRNEGNQ